MAKPLLLLLSPPPPLSLSGIKEQFSPAETAIHVKNCFRNATITHRNEWRLEPKKSRIRKFNIKTKEARAFKFTHTHTKKKVDIHAMFLCFAVIFCLLLKRSMPFGLPTSRQWLGIVLACPAHWVFLSFLYICPTLGITFA